jgi:class 3 adenylate cyclase
MPNLKKIAGLRPEGLPFLDVAELSGSGARAILMPEDSVFSSLFVGVNLEFSSLFGFETNELQSNSLTSLTGPTTDTKQLQAMWAQVLSGSEESCQYSLYHKSGAVKIITVELLPRAFNPKQNNVVSFVVAKIHEASDADSELAGKWNSQLPVAGIHQPSYSKRQPRSSLIYDESLLVDALEGEEDEWLPQLSDTIFSDDPHLLPTSLHPKDCLRPVLRSARRPSTSPPADAADGAIRTPKSRRASSALREAFPRSIAEAIMEGRRPEPIAKECVSVFFSDIVGFTALSGAMPPARVADLLNRLFAKFDALAQLHGVQKVDVIGDAYLAACNVLEDQAPDHAARLARFALDAVAAARATRLDDADPASPAVRIRVGLHSGPASAVLVGAQGFKFTLIGDTVNTASRMESTSLPGRIQCSAAAAALIADQDPRVPLAARAGGVEVKGKGHMRTCWVGQPAPALPAPRARPPSAAAAGWGCASRGPAVRVRHAAGSVGAMMSYMRGGRVPAF